MEIHEKGRRSPAPGYTSPIADVWHHTKTSFQDFNEFPWILGSETDPCEEILTTLALILMPETQVRVKANCVSLAATFQNPHSVRQNIFESCCWTTWS